MSEVESVQQEESNGSASAENTVLVPSADRISREESLKAENLHLRAIKISHERTILAMQIQDSERRFADAQQDIATYKSELADKYSIDFSRYQIRDGDGAIIPIKQ